MATEIVSEIRELEEFPNYGVDRDGNVWSKFPTSGPKAARQNWMHKLAPGRHSQGYLNVNLRVNGRSISRTVHTLVLSAFCGNRPLGAVACHANGIKTDNRPENLRWDTQKGNLADCEKHGTKLNGERTATSKLKSDQVLEIRRLYASGVSKYVIGKQFGIHPNHVNRLASKTRWKHL